MAGHFCRYSRNIWHRISVPLLVFSFSFGLLFGIGLYEGQFSVSWMRSFQRGSVSIVSLILFTFLPFLISAFAVSCRKPWLLMAVAFWKGCLFSFAAVCVLADCGSAGWLLRFLLLFSDSLSLPLLCYFWMRYIPGDRELETGVLFFLFAMVSVICCMDISVISPFWARIIEF